MKTISSTDSFAYGIQQHGIYRVARFVVLVMWLCGALGCGTEAEPSSAGEALAMQEAAQDTDSGVSLDGLSVNGLSVNGLSVNGLSVNGLSVNGLSVNGLQTLIFQDWFEEDPTLRSNVMKYVVQCALPSGQSRGYTSPVTGRTYLWRGQFGLAPRWTTGNPATVAEQQLVTACLAAHANKFGMHISLSVLGKTAMGSTIPYTATELATYSETEACFFGNTFADEGIFAANDRNYLRSWESSPRACGLSALEQSTDCAPIIHVGTCRDYCTLDATGTFYTQCTYNGVSYLPITTRMLPKDIYSCGDGVCQFTESCGLDATYNSCQADCGQCP
ncbi:hypothetical protein [Hyalangium gracile]|uniref:hypothetical protein n=1 Tax=Hyalangium gracile TaxID=394092 RepID=UPI001CCADA5C|nr:hypothetical protein [Hyalangium gracile]